MTPTIAIINASTVISDEELLRVVLALKAQLNRDFEPAWGLSATLLPILRGETPPDGAWWLTIADDSDVAMALGYHDLTKEGNPLGLVFAKTDLDFGYSWTVTASHELLEMLADPDINLMAYRQVTRRQTWFYAYEVCDAVETDALGYQIDGVLVSDFVTPEWFEGFRAPGSVKFDFQGHVERPFGILPGGYMLVFEVGKGGHWEHETPNEQVLAAHQRPRLGSRRLRRMTPREQWQPSTCHHQ